VLGLLCCSGFFLAGVSRGYSLVVVYRLLIAVASLLWSTGSRVLGLQKLELPGSRAQAQQWWCTGLIKLFLNYIKYSTIEYIHLYSTHYKIVVIIMI